MAEADRSTLTGMKTPSFLTLGRCGLTVLLLAATPALAAGGPSAGPAAATVPVEAPRSGAFGDYLAALAAERIGDFGSASRLMLRASDADPDNGQLANHAFALLVADNQVSRALTLARRLQDSGQQTIPLVRIALAADAMRTGDVGKARDLLSAKPSNGLEQLALPLLSAWAAVGEKDRPAMAAALSSLESEPSLAPLVALHRWLMLRVLGDEAAARTALDQVVTVTTAPSLRFVLLVGPPLAAAGEQATAQSLYDSFRARQADSAMALDDLMAEKNAIEPVDTAAAGMATALFDLGSLLAQQQLNQIALNYVRLAQYMQPDLPIAGLLVGEIQEAQGRDAAATETFRTLAEEPAYGWIAGLRLADSLAAQDRIDEALEVLDKLIVARPDRYEAAFRKGNILRSVDRFAEAVDAYDLAVARIKPVEPVDWPVFYFRGIALERSKQWSKAEADFRKALELEPDQPFVLNYLAYSWVDRNLNLEQAEKMLLRAVELRPRDGFIVDSLGWVYYRMGRYAEAVSALENAISLEPSDPTINDPLGDAYWRDGRKREARVQWRRALSFEPEAEDAEKIREKLQSGLPPVVEPAKGRDI